MLLAYADEHDLAVNAILSLAVAEFRAQRDGTTVTDMTKNATREGTGG